MAIGLRGAPIVGYFRKEDGDFEEHNRLIDISGDRFEVIDMTKPYGFVDLNAPIWFQDFQDDETAIHTYLVTEGYLWTDAYPESQRVLDEGNNQSMEISDRGFDGYVDYEGNHRGFFIITEAIIQKLCILGENFEPCFEGSQIATSFSLNDELEKLMQGVSAMIQTLKEGGLKREMPEDVTQNTSYSLEEPTTTEEPVVEEPIVVEPASEPAAEPAIDYAAKLQEATEQIETITQKFNQLQQDYNSLSEQFEALKEFKLQVERQQKQDMINSFFMLSDEDKADVVANIDTYSLDEIESKLSVICVRNKVNFNLTPETPIATTFSLQQTEVHNDIPDWIKAVQENM